MTNETGDDSQNQVTLDTFYTKRPHKHENLGPSRRKVKTKTNRNPFNGRYFRSQNVYILLMLFLGYNPFDTTSIRWYRRR